MPNIDAGIVNYEGGHGTGVNKNYYQRFVIERVNSLRMVPAAVNLTTAHK